MHPINWDSKDKTETSNQRHIPIEKRSSDGTNSRENLEKDLGPHREPISYEVDESSDDFHSGESGVGGDIDDSDDS